MNKKAYFINNFNKIIDESNKLDFINLVLKEENKKIIIDNNLFWIHLDKIINKYGEWTLMSLFITLLEYDKKIVNSDFLKIFDYNISPRNIIDLFDLLNNNNIDLNSIFTYIINNKLDNVPANIIINYINKNTKYSNVLFDNFNILIDKSYNLLEMKNSFKENKLFYNRLIDYIKNNNDKVIYNMLMSSLHISREEIDKEYIFNTIKVIVKELLNNENKNIEDINIIGKGGTTLVFEIGDKVLKLGPRRNILKIDNNKRYLKPIIRQNINSILTNKPFCCIEITEKVDTNNITEEDAYKIYKELREQGLVWLDCYPQNLGRLIKPNKVYFNDNINPNKDSISYNNYNDEELESSELVIIDNDLIYSEDYINQNKELFEDFNNEDLPMKFNFRYQMEKTQKIVK